MMKEYSFRVKTGESPLMRFTAENPNHRILIHLLRASTSNAEERALVIFLGPVEQSNRFLKGEFGRRYGTFTPVREGHEHVSVEMGTHLLPLIQGRRPDELTYEVLGPDTVFLPLTLHKGWITVRVLSANPEAGGKFQRLLEILKHHFQPDATVMFPNRPYRGDRMFGQTVEDITTRQLEVITTAFHMGYWADPRRCNLDDIAKRLGVSKAAVHKSLAAGQRKIMAAFFDELGVETDVARGLEDSLEPKISRDEPW